MKELAGRPISVQVLKQFGLVDNEKVDLFLASAFAKTGNHAEAPRKEPEKREVQQAPEVSRPDQPNRSS